MPLKLCPKCNAPIVRAMALSRRDNETMICARCGTREALEDFYGSDRAMVERMLNLIDAIRS
jgi:transcription elongation factor Elf1